MTVCRRVNTIAGAGRKHRRPGPECEPLGRLGRTKGAITRFAAPAYWKFESIFLQRRVRCELNLGKGGLPMRLPPGLLGAAMKNRPTIPVRPTHTIKNAACAGVMLSTITSSVAPQR